MEIVWTDYLRYRAGLRGFDLGEIEQIVRYSSERYYDLTTGRYAVVGRRKSHLVLVAYERVENTITPVTVHATTRQQINLRLKSGRLQSE